MCGGLGDREKAVIFALHAGALGDDEDVRDLLRETLGDELPPVREAEAQLAAWLRDRLGEGAVRDLDCLSRDEPSRVL